MFLLLLIGLAAYGQNLSYWRTVPPVVVPGQTQQLNLQVAPQGAPSRVTFESALQPGVEVDMADNGTGGDSVAGDGVFSITINAQPFVNAMRPDDVFRPFLGFVRPYTSGTAANRFNIFAEVAGTDIPSVPVTAKAADAQHTQYLVNIWHPPSFAATSFANQTLLTNRFYALYPDEFDFLNIVYLPSYFLNRTHGALRNSVSGIGLSLFDGAAAYGSASRLLGISTFPNTVFFDGAGIGFQHELGHQWINFMNVPPVASGRPHWPYSTMAAGIMGFSIPPTGQGGNFGCLIVPEGAGIRLSPRTAAPVFNGLDLYLMGLLPPDQVGEQIVLDDQTQAPPCAGNLYTGTFTRLRVDQLVASFGTRTPTAATARKRFRAATILVTRDGLLPPEAMSFYSYFAQRGELTVETQAQEGFLKQTVKPFALSTRGLGSLDMRIIQAPQITSPAPGTALTSNLLTLNWSPVSRATKYRICLGSSPGSTSLFCGETSAPSLTVGHLPTSGAVYVEISALVDGAYEPPALASYAVCTSCPAAVGLRFVAAPPCRVADTRLANGAFGGPMLAAGGARDFVIPSSGCGIPATARAYSINVTVAPSGPLGYLTVYPTGVARPFVSTLNSFDGSVVANAAIVPAGNAGAISVYATDATHVILDINGYFVADGTGGSALSFYPATPCRAADTRLPAGAFGGPAFAAGHVRSFALPLSNCSIPAGAQAFASNVTVVPRGPLGYLTAWPTGAPQPFVSTLNSFQGEVVANAAIVPSGPGGSINVFATDPTDVVLDVSGYFAAPGQARALRFFPVTPCRVADTRLTAGAFGSPAMTPSSTRNFPIPSSSCGIPATALAYALNVTVVPSEPLGYLTTWPAGSPQPLVSTLNSFLGKVVANAAIVPAGTDGAIQVFVTGRTEVILDVNGYFEP